MGVIAQGSGFAFQGMGARKRTLMGTDKEPNKMGKGIISGKQRSKVSLDDLLPPDFLDDLLPSEDRDALVADKESKKATYSNIKKQLAQLAAEEKKPGTERFASRAKPKSFITFWLRASCICGASYQYPRSLRPLVKYESSDGTIRCLKEPWRDPNSLPFETSFSEHFITRCVACQPTSLPFYPMVVAGPLLTSWDPPRTCLVRSERDARKILGPKPKPRAEAIHGSASSSGGSHIRELQHEIEIIQFAYSIVEECNQPENLPLAQDHKESSNA